MNLIKYKNSTRLLLSSKVFNFLYSTSAPVQKRKPIKEHIPNDSEDTINKKFDEAVSKLDKKYFKETFTQNEEVFANSIDVQTEIYDYSNFINKFENSVSKHFIRKMNQLCNKSLLQREFFPIIVKAVDSQNKLPILLEGESGNGKTGLLVNISNYYKLKEHVVIYFGNIEKIIEGSYNIEVSSTGVTYDQPKLTSELLNDIIEANSDKLKKLPFNHQDLKVGNLYELAKYGATNHNEACAIFEILIDEVCSQTEYKTTIIADEINLLYAKSQYYTTNGNHIIGYELNTLNKIKNILENADLIKNGKLIVATSNLYTNSDITKFGAYLYNKNIKIEENYKVEDLGFTIDRVLIPPYSFNELAQIAKFYHKKTLHNQEITENNLNKWMLLTNGNPAKVSDYFSSIHC